MSLCFWCSCCYSCLTFSLTNISSFSCSKHKALMPNVINSMKPGQYLTGKDLIPTCLCLFVLKISEQYLSSSALSHRTKDSNLNCWLWNQCLLNNPLLLFRSEAQFNITSETGHGKTYHVICLWGRKQHHPQTSNSPHNPAIISWLINEPSVWSQSPPTKRRQDQVLSWHWTKTYTLIKGKS